MAQNSYFYNFPKVSYDVLGNGNPILLTDILHSVKLQDILVNNSYVYYEWAVQNDDSPEDIAFKYYGDANYFWVILIANQIYDRYFDWPLSIVNFNNWITDTYGSIEQAYNMIHHYEDGDGNIIDLPTYQSSGGIVVSYYDYFFNLNEAKRNIKLIDKIYLNQVHDDLINILQSLTDN